MPANLSHRVDDCYRRADECRERAGRASSPSSRAMFRKLEQQWLNLARSCELDESAYRLAEVARYFSERRGPPPAHWR
ncbi:MAG: hypothetical protein K2Y71_15375 [Xanthobacteraceae bacterium]|nr:hypothetical protein [Xanthobacteraceae bacterium]